jgi:hypothetical protein
MNANKQADSSAPATITENGSGKKPPRKRRMAREPQTEANADTGAKAQTLVEQPGTERSRAQSKIAMVLALLERSEGATLDEMIEATGWLPHTTRAALTGLKKKGHSITKSKRDDVTCYFITKPAL